MLMEWNGMEWNGMECASGSVAGMRERECASGNARAVMRVMHNK